MRYFAAARVPWDGLGGVPYSPVQVSDGEMDGWTLGSTMAYDAQAVPTAPPKSEAEIEVESPQCLEESASETPVTEAVAGAAYESPDDKAESADELSNANPAVPEAPEVCFRSAALVSRHCAFAHMHCGSSDPHKTKRFLLFEYACRARTTGHSCKLVLSHLLQHCCSKTITATPGT